MLGGDFGKVAARGHIVPIGPVMAHTLVRNHRGSKDQLRVPLGLCLGPWGGGSQEINLEIIRSGSNELLAFSTLPLSTAAAWPPLRWL